METTFRSDERFTQAEFAAWLDKHARNLTGTCELIGGSIVMAPPAHYPHGTLITNLIFCLESHVRSGKLGKVHAASAGYEFRSGDTLEPDVSFVSTARLRQGPAPRSGQFMRVVPDLVVEVLSRPNEKYDRTEKKRIYARNGVDEYWLVAPRTRSVTLFSRDGSDCDEGITFVNGEIRSRILPKLDLTIDSLFEGVD